MDPSIYPEGLRRPGLSPRRPMPRPSFVNAPPPKVKKKGAQK